MIASALFEQEGAKDTPRSTGIKTGDGITYRTEKITPERASRLIATMDRTPPLDKKAVAHYAGVMRAGGWVENGQPIILDEHGVLMDGYHRLMACLEADTPFTTLVARGARRDTLHTIDQHRRRGFTGVLESRGVPHAGDVQRSLNKLIRIENGIFRKHEIPISWSRLDLVLDSNPELIEATKIAHDLPRGHIPAKARTPLIFMALKAGHGEKIRQFFRDMEDTNIGADNPARMLDLNLQSIIENTSLRNVDPDVALALSIKAFNDYVASKKPKSIYSWKPDYGKATKLDSAGQPLSIRDVRQNAPANCGLPVMDGYPGIVNGKIADTDTEMKSFSGETANMLIEAAQSGAKVKVRMVDVTPAMAQEWLDNYNTVNREIQKTHVNQIARDIKQGNWMVNAQPIAFHGNPLTKNGPARLINGQHRLKACIMADTPIEVPIAIDVPEEAFATYDTHMKRSKTVHGGDSRVVKSAALLQWREDMQLPLRHRDRPTATEQEKTIDKHPQLIDYAAKVRLSDGMGQESRLDSFATGGVMTYFLYRIHREDEQLAEQFVNSLRTGANLEMDNPVRQLRSQASRDRKGATRLNRYDALDLLLNGWDRYKKWAHKKEKETEQLDLL
jgi:hypothetical protein